MMIYRFKKMLLAVSMVLAIGCITGTDASAGEYDGVWAVNQLPGVYMMIRSNGATIVAMGWDSSDADYVTVYVGTLSGTSANLTAINDYASMTLNFSSSSSGYGSESSSGGPYSIVKIL